MSFLFGSVLGEFRSDAEADREYLDYNLEVSGLGEDFLLKKHATLNIYKNFSNGRGQEENKIAH